MSKKYLHFFNNTGEIDTSKLYDSPGVITVKNTNQVAYANYGPNGSYKVNIVDGKVKPKEYESWMNTYQEVEYLESTGTQYIDTGLISTISTSHTYILTGILKNSSNSGNWQGSNGRLQHMFTSTRVSDGTNEVSLPDSECTLIIDYNSGTKQQKNYLNGTLFGTRDWTSYGTSNPIYICKMGGYDATGVYEKIVSGQIMENNVLVRDFIPVKRKSDSKPGLYDKVNNIFYVNQGSGEFTVGPDIN